MPPPTHPFALPLLDALVCPDDRARLFSPGRGEVSCVRCGRSFRVSDGIVSLLPLAPPWSPVESEAAEAEQRQRDKEAGKYDRLVGLWLFSLLETPALLGALGARPGERVVEIGCGTGRMTVRMARAGAEIVALDHSLESLRRLRGKLGEAGANAVQLVQADASCIPVRDEWATRALAAGMLQHLSSDEIRGRAVAELARVLQARGRMAASIYQYTPALRRLMPREGRHSGAICFRRFTEAEYRALLETHFELDRPVTPLLYVLVAHAIKRGR